jgi:predicted phosphodiesterase
MNIQVLSDTHFEFHHDSGKTFFKTLDPTGVDVLVIAGDVATKARIGIGLRQFCAMYPHVVYTPGNHESYHRAWGWIDLELQRLSEECPNLHVLQNSSVEIDGQRFLGCTLWYPYCSAAEEFRDKFSDFLYILDTDPNLFDMNQKSIKYLWNNARKGDVVVTHHMPTPRATPAQFKDSPINPFFVCEMEGLIKTWKPALWVFGHTHSSYDEVIAGTRLVCNPLGYVGEKISKPLVPKENPQFDWRKIITLPSNDKNLIS